MAGQTIILRDGAGGHRDPLALTIKHDGDMVVIGADGYGEKNGTPDSGGPVVIELYEGQLRVIVWGDINSEDPTHIIPLDGALETARK
jgi:hypothetical protein